MRPRRSKPVRQGRSIPRKGDRNRPLTQDGELATRAAAGGVLVLVLAFAAYAMINNDHELLSRIWALINAVVLAIVARGRARGGL